MRPRARARLFALVEQRPTTALDLTVEHVVQLGRLPHLSRLRGHSSADQAAIERAMVLAGIEPLWGRRFSTLSGGERQRVHLAAAFAQEPDVLLLDEPTNHLDVGAQLELLDRVAAFARSGAIVLAALHHLDHVAMYADRAVLLVNGRVSAQGPPEQVLGPTLLGTAYGVTVDLVTHPRTGRAIPLFSRPPSEQGLKRGGAPSATLAS